ncbi:hypothetical protein C9439_04835 [archaeon SCG-AAA382B04]|nr:hypothetical protein C9439_04835 [archaeon SCG-AAA382B04]
MSFKKETRILGIDDGPFKKFSSKETILVGSVFRGGEWLDGVLTDKITVDGFDSTKKIIDLINNSRHKKQLQTVFLDGLTFAGMNIVDIKKLNNQVSLPIVIVSRKKPDFESIKRALKNVSKSEKRWKLIKKAGEPIKVKTNSRKEEKPIFIQVEGMEESKAKELTKMISTRSRIPEPIRISHLISTGIVRGESYGNA